MNHPGSPNKDFIFTRGYDLKRPLNNKRPLLSMENPQLGWGFRKAKKKKKKKDMEKKKKKK
ncbi:hypothetical protein, partial [Salmonella enterica]|uniref:hypothetical protein n=1 Tax=Salmonella enterica TaxID=28901 RepID=UPI001C3956DA